MSHGISGSGFDRSADRYENWYETKRGRRANDAERRLLRSLLKLDGKKGSLLEVGCGTGHFTEWLQREAGHRALGLDASTPMLRELRRRGRRFPVVRGDAHRLPFAARSFDHVLFITTLEFLDDPEVALREAVRVARSQVVVVWLNPWSAGGLRRACSPHRRSSGARRLTVSDVRRMLTRSASDRARDIVWVSSLFPWPLSTMQLRVPLGDVLGMQLAIAPCPAAEYETEIRR